MIGGSIQAELTRSEVDSIALEGFFPKVAHDEQPDRGARIGLQEFGLPFVADPAVPKHLSDFLRRHRAEAVSPVDPLAGDRPLVPMRSCSTAVR